MLAVPGPTGGACDTRADGGLPRPPGESSSEWPGGGSSGSDGEVLLSADVARLSRYNDEVAT